MYQMAQQKATFQAGEMHVDRGMKLRAQGQLGEALLEFQKAYAINPGAAITTQELRLTQEMIERERRRVEQTGKESTPQERALTPVEEVKKREMEKIDRILPVPELKPMHPEPLDLKMSGQKTKVIFETIGKLAGINVLWDPEINPGPRHHHGGFSEVHFGGGAGLRRADHQVFLEAAFAEHHLHYQRQRQQAPRL